MKSKDFAPVILDRFHVAGADPVDRMGRLLREMLTEMSGRFERENLNAEIERIANAALTALDRDFAVLYPARIGRPSIPPERLLRDAAASIVRDPIRAPTDGADGV